MTGVEFLAGTNSLGFGSLLALWHQPPAFELLHQPVLHCLEQRTGRFVCSHRQSLRQQQRLRCFHPGQHHHPAAPAAACLPTRRSSTSLPLTRWRLRAPIAGSGRGPTNATGTWTDWPGGDRVPVTNCGPKNATFSVYRTADTNGALTVTYAIGGTASNGVDYVALPGTVTIPAGQRQAMISVVPLDDGPPDRNSTVILRLTPHMTKAPRLHGRLPGERRGDHLRQHRRPTRRRGPCPTGRSISTPTDPTARGSMSSIPRTC